MSNEIKPGDRAVVFKYNPCCGSGKVGLFVNVLKLEFCEFFECGFCGSFHFETVLCTTDHGLYVQLYRLKKIPPLSELESQTSSLDNPIKEPHKEKV